MNYYTRLISQVTIRRSIVLTLLIIFFFIIKSFLPLMLLTTITIYLLSQFIKFFRRKVKISSKLMTLVTYFFIISTILYLTLKYIPIVAKETIQLLNSLESFYDNTNHFKNILGYDISIYVRRIIPYLQSKTSSFYHIAQGTVSFFTTILFSFVLSFFFLIEQDKVILFSNLFLKGKLSWLFGDIYFFGEKFLISFGKVIYAQIAIAIMNSLLTSLVLIFLKFPHIASLFSMILILSFIPVVGVVISFFPLSIIAYSNGGVKDVIIILVTILSVHLLESYVLNPKFMSKSTELPMFFTFIILIFSEHYLGLWGLILGVPITLFILDILDIKK
ncbi:AI-2E family transporter [Vagococcus fluvialis]|uniref:AI-2E family transporter n=1 Tax=Vagococcus fluvialis TaxID=2738 RepID=A0A7X6DA37_9ENTE|nr:AI-2E family transporter [Vagococcus fluvialis]NKC68570.1 AI-2E family transporter [Vagococcus fluvialis]